MCRSVIHFYNLREASASHTFKQSLESVRHSYVYINVLESSSIQTSSHYITKGQDIRRVSMKKTGGGFVGFFTLADFFLRKPDSYVLLKCRYIHELAHMAERGRLHLDTRT